MQKITRVFFIAQMSYSLVIFSSSPRHHPWISQKTACKTSATAPFFQADCNSHTEGDGGFEASKKIQRNVHTFETGEDCNVKQSWILGYLLANSNRI